MLLGILYATRRDTIADLTPEEAIAADAAPGIAVLPFTVNDPDLATWREGMVDLMTVNLDGVPGLRPIASRTVLARWRSEAPDVADLGASLLVARRTGALCADRVGGRRRRRSAVQRGRLRRPNGELSEAHRPRARPTAYWRSWTGSRSASCGNCRRERTAFSQGPSGGRDDGVACRR